MTRKLTIIDEVNIRLTGFPYDEMNHLIEKSKIRMKDAHMYASFKIGTWDGKESFITPNGYSYTYLLDKILDWLEEYGVDSRNILLDDCRDSSIYTPNPISDDLFSDYDIFLRYYQVEAVNKAIQHQKGFIEAATSAGKTLICAALCHAYSPAYKTLTIVPSEKLLNDTHKTYKSVGLDSGKFVGNKKEQVAKEKKHIVTTWQTLYRNKELLNDIGVIIYDEAHIMGGAMFDALRENLASAPIRIGMSASLPKTDKFKWTTIRTRIGGDVLFKIEADQLIREGYISSVDIVIQPFEHVDLERFTEWEQEQKYLFQNEERLEEIAVYINSLPDTNTLVLCHPQAGNWLARMLGLDFIDKDVDVKIRESYFSQYENQNNYKLVASWGTSSTGISIDDIYTLVIIDTGKDVSKIIQGIGRGMRKDSKNINHVTVHDLYSVIHYSSKHAKERKKKYQKLKYPYKEKQAIKFGG